MSDDGYPDRFARYRARHPERCAEAHRKHYEKNLERIRERARIAAAKRRAADPDGEREKQRAWRAANPHKSRAHQVKIKYKLSMEQVEALFDKQGQCCAVCKSTERGPVRNWPIDHDHATGEVRGILCQSCNIVLHAGRDTEEFLQKLIEYVRNPPAKETPP